MNASNRSPLLFAALLAFAACHHDSVEGPTPQGPPGQPSAASSPTRVPIASPTAAQASTPASQATAGTRLDPVAGADLAFAAALYPELAKTVGSGNLFFSPLSAEVALAMTLAGASGNTATQLASALHLDLSSPDVLTEMAALLASLRADSGTSELDLANALWGQTRGTFAAGFESVLKTTYGAPMGRLDFNGDADAARGQINRWASDATHGKIPDLFAPGAIDANTRLVLASAAYFKGTWSVPFDAKATTDAPFHVTPSRTVSAKTMSLSDNFRSMHSDELSILELPYAGGALAMDVLLPAKPDGLPTLESNLATLSAWLAQLEPEQVDVSLPRFETTSAFALHKPLAALGISDAFDPAKADFSGMDNARDLFLGVAVQKAFVSVDELGTTAAAATGIAVQNDALILGARFQADHPFLFLIRDTKTSAILFLGRISDPTTK